MGLAAIASTIRALNISQTDTVLFSGCSAGAQGVVVQLDRTASLLPNPDVCIVVECVAACSVNFLPAVPVAVCCVHSRDLFELLAGTERVRFGRCWLDAGRNAIHRV